MKSNNLRCEIYPANFPLLKKKKHKKKDTAPFVEFKDGIQISGSVCVIEI